MGAKVRKTAKNEWATVEYLPEPYDAIGVTLTWPSEETTRFALGPVEAEQLANMLVTILAHRKQKLLKKKRGKKP